MSLAYLCYYCRYEKDLCGPLLRLSMFNIQYPISNIQYSKSNICRYGKDLLGPLSRLSMFTMTVFGTWDSMTLPWWVHLFRLVRICCIAKTGASPVLLQKLQMLNSEVLIKILRDCCIFYPKNIAAGYEIVFKKSVWFKKGQTWIS